MPIEIEKKYRLPKTLRKSIEKRLRDLGVQPGQLEFEENTLYGGGKLNFGGCALRLRRVNDKAILTFKQRIPSKSPIKHQREEETAVADATAVDAILRSLGYQPRLVYEKRRVRWQAGKTEVVIDELPFGLFMEIEGSERDIRRLEKTIGAADLTAVVETYPTLTAKFGKERKGVVEARFKKKAK